MLKILYLTLTQSEPILTKYLLFTPTVDHVCELCGFRCTGASAQSDPLPTWNEGATKKSITDFVARVTTPGGADFVPPAERIATFDNDGTLWCEQPVYFQVAFAFDRLNVVAEQQPKLRAKQPFKAALDKDGLDFPPEMTRPQFADAVRKEHAFWGPKLKELDIKFE